MIMAEISKTLAEMINKQINAEFESAYLYLGMSNYYIGRGFIGLGSWFATQAKEENEHAEKFIAYLNQEGHKVILSDIKAPKEEYGDLREPLVKQLAHEQGVTALIYALVNQAEKDKDYRSLSFLKWYVDEQTEEEAHSRDLILQYDFMKDDVAALLRWDKTLGKRD